MEEKKKKVVNYNFLMCDVIFTEETENLESAKMSTEMALKLAGSIFTSLCKGGKLNLYKLKKSKDGDDVIPYHNDVMAVHNGISVLRVNNNKNKNVVEEADTMTNGITDYETNTYVSNPFCFVIIDNREEKGICQIAIQKNDAWGDTKGLRELLEQYWNTQFLNDGIPLRVTISPKTRPSEIWEFCRERCGVGKDSITRIAFEFPNQTKVAVLNRIPKPRGYVKQLAELSKFTNAIKTHIHMDYDGADPETIEKNMNDLANIVQICSNTEYDLSVYFKKYGQYRCNDVVKAIFPMDETILNAFMMDWNEQSCTPQQRELFAWCDEAYEQGKLFENAEQIPSKRCRQNP